MTCPISYRFISPFCCIHLWSQRRYLLLSLVVVLIPMFFLSSETKAVANRECVSLEEGQSTYNLDKAVSYYEDQSTNLTLQEILDTPSLSWTPIGGVVPSFGFSSSIFWLKFDMCKSQPQEERPVLEINYPLLDSITLFGVAGRTIVYEVHTGDGIPYSQRPEKHRNFIFLLPDSEQESLSFYLRVQTESSVQVPMRLYTSTEFSMHNQGALLIQGVYFGIILSMILYNSFLFLSLREWPYLLYVFFTLSYFSFQGVLQGFFQQFVFDSIWWQNHSLLLFGFSSILFANLFADSFLNLKKKYPYISKLLRGIGLISLLAAILASALPYALMVKVMLAFAVPSSFLILVAGYKLWWIGHLPARIFTLAWSTLLFSFVLASFNKFGLLPRIFWTENIMQIGGVLEVILLSIALGERINEEKRQRILVEQSLSTSLEEKVLTRTLELNTALEKLGSTNAILETEQEKLEAALQEISGNHRELEKAYNDLKYAQDQLLQAEKMQSVGRLAAGVAHEINTPIQFVGDNVRFILESIGDIEKLLEVHNRIVETSANGAVSPDLIKKAKAIAEEIDLSYLREEMPLAIQQSLEGTDRIANIVRAMKEFSHPGSKERSSINLNEAIKSAATVSRNEWKYHAELELDLDPELPQVFCLEGEINQVVLNLIINAAHAIKNSPKAASCKNGLIRIQTHLKDEGKFVIIRIHDNGSGIPDSILTKIFDPFFTTKAVGQGTGQGLAIVYSTIVDKHGGSIEVESKVEKGTTFFITLPIDEQILTS